VRLDWVEMPVLEKAAIFPYDMKYFDTDRRKFLFTVGHEKI
jgi:hypothetical protein